MCVAYEEDDRSKIYTKKRIEEPVIPSFEEAYEFIKRHIGERYVIEGKRGKKVPEVPEKAFREALINGIMHRDYQAENENIQVDVFPDRIEISNPGGLVPGMREEDLGRKSMPRNKQLARLLERANFAEESGTGIRRMERLMEENELPPPKFDHNSHFQVTLFRKKEVHVLDSYDGKINSRQKKGLQLVFEQGNITSAEYRELNKDISRHTAWKELKDLVEQGVLDQKGRTKGTKYVLSNEVVEGPREASEKPEDHEIGDFVD